MSVFYCFGSYFNIILQRGDIVHHKKQVDEQGKI